MECPWCIANLDDLRRAEESELQPLIERMQQSTVQYLRSRSVKPDEIDTGRS